MTSTTAELDPKLCNYSLLRKASRRVSLAYDRTLSSSGLTTAQFAILVEVGGWPDAEGPTMAALADALIMDRAALTQSLKPLVEGKLVRIARDARDRRARRALLTRLGAERLREAGGLWERAQLAFAQAVGEQELAILRAALRMVVSRVTLPLVPPEERTSEVSADRREAHASARSRSRPASSGGARRSIS